VFRTLPSAMELYKRNAARIRVSEGGVADGEVRAYVRCLPRTRVPVEACHDMSGLRSGLGVDRVRVPR
jgi:hypothetical protein